MLHHSICLSPLKIMLTLCIFFCLLMQVWSLFGSQMFQTFCIERLRISAQYRVQILQSCKDIIVGIYDRLVSYKVWN